MIGHIGHIDFREWNNIIQQEYRKESKEFIKTINSKKKKHKRGIRQRV